MNRVFKDGVELFDVTVTIIGEGDARSTVITQNKPGKPGVHPASDGGPGEEQPPPPPPRPR